MCVRWRRKRNASRRPGAAGDPARHDLRGGTSTAAEGRPPSDPDGRCDWCERRAIWESLPDPTDPFDRRRGGRLCAYHRLDGKPRTNLPANTRALFGGLAAYQRARYIPSTRTPAELHLLAQARGRKGGSHHTPAQKAASLRNIRLAHALRRTPEGAEAARRQLAAMHAKERTPAQRAASAGNAAKARAAMARKRRETS